MSDTAARLAVRKTYKLYIGGAFPRSESGRSYAVTDHKGGFLANAALASRKDARDAVSAARKAFAGWSGATAYNRGQVLYRVAELLEGRRAQFTAEVRAAEGLGSRAAEAVVDAAIDRWVWYAGWSDKITQVRGSANPVAGPYFNFSLPEPLAWWRCSPRRIRACSVSCQWSLPRWSAATPWSCWPASASRCPRCRCRRCSPPRTCPAA